MNRRRTLSILAGTTAAALTGCGGRESLRVARWKGVLFNAEVDLTLHDLPRADGEALIGRCVGEMQRLESLFSLYEPESVLCGLNRDGAVAEAPQEFLALLEEALRVAAHSKGTFDPTVQPYWVWLRQAVESDGRIDPEEQGRQLAKVDYRKVRIDGKSVRFESDGMGITLNGIAQGWITDRVCDLLREGGAQRCLVNLGEFYAMGAQQSGADWRVALRGHEEREVSLRERALAVSSGAGMYFGTGAGKNHLIDPRTGRCAEDERIVAVTAKDACTADALSTACSVLEDEDARDLVNRWDGAALQIVRPG